MGAPNAQYTSHKPPEQASQPTERPPAKAANKARHHTNAELDGGAAHRVSTEASATNDLARVDFALERDREDV